MLQLCYICIAEMDQHFGQVLHLGLPSKIIEGTSSAKASVVGKYLP